MYNEFTYHQFIYFSLFVICILIIFYLKSFFRKKRSLLNINLLEKRNEFDNCYFLDFHNHFFLSVLA